MHFLHPHVRLIASPLAYRVLGALLADYIRERESEGERKER
jgi:hypothetical protein